MFSQGYSLHFSHFCSFLVVWGLGSWIGFLGLGFSVDGVKGFVVGPSGFLGLGLSI